MTKTLPKPFAPPRPINAGNPFIFGFGGGCLEPDEWVGEAKLHGERILIHIETGEVFNRRMEPYSKVSHIEQALKTLLEKMKTIGEPAFEWIDAEALCCKGCGLGEGSISVIDIDAPGNLEERRELFAHLATFPLTGNARGCSVYKMPRVPFNKVAALWRKLVKLDRSLFEGVVLKRKSSRYEKNYFSSTKETTSWLKHRFQ